MGAVQLLLLVISRPGGSYSGSGSGSHTQPCVVHATESRES